MTPQNTSVEDPEAEEELADTDPAAADQFTFAPDPEDTAPKGPAKKRAYKRRAKKPEAEAPPSAPRGRPRTPRRGTIAQGVTGYYAAFGMGLMSMGMPASAQAFMESAEDFGEQWEELAKQSPKVKRQLEKLMSGGAGMKLAMSHVAAFSVLAQELRARRQANMEPQEEPPGPDPFTAFFNSQPPGGVHPKSPPPERDPGGSTGRPAYVVPPNGAL